MVIAPCGSTLYALQLVCYMLAALLLVLVSAVMSICYINQPQSHPRDDLDLDRDLDRKVPESRRNEPQSSTMSCNGDRIVTSGVQQKESDPLLS